MTKLPMQSQVFTGVSLRRKETEQTSLSVLDPGEAGVRPPNAVNYSNVPHTPTM